MTQHLHGAARQQLLDDVRNLYVIGMTIREIAAQTGYSYTATHQQLAAAGVKFRPKRRPVIELRSGVDPLKVACPKCGVEPSQECRAEYGGRARRTHAARKWQIAREARDGA